MGINIHVYTVYGFKIPWNDEFFEAYELYQEKLYGDAGYDQKKPSPNRLDVICDCMAGEYMILGPILYDSGDFRYMEDMNDYSEIDLDLLHQMKNIYYLKFRNQFPDHIDLLGEGAGWKLINVIHYT